MSLELSLAYLTASCLFSSLLFILDLAKHPRMNGFDNILFRSQVQSKSFDHGRMMNRHSANVDHPGPARLEPLYSPLDDSRHDIRLVTISPDLTNGFVSVKMQTVHGQVPYRCLSYRWGQPQPDAEILVNNVPVRVRKNLYDFLHTMRGSVMSLYGSMHCASTKQITLRRDIKCRRWARSTRMLRRY